MDLRVYYQKIRETVAKYPDKDVVIVSRATGDGGRSGVCTEVPKEIAAVMVVEGTADVAEEHVAEAYRKAVAEARLLAEEQVAASRVPLSLVSTAELHRLRGMPRQES
jgi:hypothetical protein